MDPILKNHFEKLITLSKEEYEYISSHFIHKKFRKHQYLVQEGSLVLYDYFVVSGCLKAYYLNKAGKEHILQFGL